jgi:erythromycin esterase
MRWSRSPIVWILAAAVIVTLTSRAAGQEGHSHAISLTDGADFSDLAFLAKVLKDKRLVLLGESNHGSREFNLQKNRLIRFPHEELGFGVLLLESGMGEVYAIDYRRGELSEGRMLSAGLVGPWRTLEYKATRVDVATALRYE